MLADSVTESLICYRHRLASGQGIVVLDVCVCVCPPSRDCSRSAELVSAAKVMRCIQCSLVFTRATLC